MNDPLTQMRRERRLRPITHLVCAVMLAACLLPAAPHAAAEEVTSLYTAQVPLDPRAPQSRSQAYAAALDQIVARITGSRDSLPPERLHELFPDPARYVLQYQPGEDETLWVTLDGTAIGRVLMSAGYRVWGSDRPLTLVWLAVDWGDGEREIVAADDAQRTAGEARSIDRNHLLRERVEEAARRRGIPVAFPLLDAEDLENISFSDIWGGFDDQLLEASRRYDARSILVGRIRPGPAQTNRWTYYFGGEERQWGGEPEAVINLLADTMGAQFAISRDEQLADIPVTISGIDSVAAYGTVQSYLEELSLVRHLSIDAVTGDRIRFVIKAYGDRERLRRALETARNLEPDDAGQSLPSGGVNAPADALSFRYRP